MKVHEIIPGRLYQRGEFDGFSPEAKLARLRELGIRYVVNLVKNIDEDIASEVTYFHHPIPDGKRIEPGALLGLARGVATLMGSMGGATLVHCHAGRNRSGLLNALIARELLGLPGSEALGLVQERRPNSLANEKFAEFVASLPAPVPLKPRQLLYVIGQPGSGKSSLVASLTGGLPAIHNKQPFAHTVYGSTPIVVEFGAHRLEFSGTDALSMSVQPLAVEWLQHAPYSFVIAEGDRLANAKFFNAATAADWELTVIRLAVSANVAEHRRAARGSNQDPTWLRGRISKVKNLAAAWPTVELDADQPQEAVRQQLLATGNPVAAILSSSVRL